MEWSVNRSLYFAFVIAALAVVTFIALRAQRRSREIACADNLKYIGIAIHNYKDCHGRIPSPDADGHSWRIRIVPFLFASAMYASYRFDEPWDSQNNITLDSRPLPVKDGGPDRPHGMPYPYECSQGPESRSRTSFLMFVGEKAFGKPGDYRRWEEITDPLECTLVAAETTPTSIHWLEPKDFDLQSMSFTINDPDALCISSTHPRGPAVLFADGRVYRMSISIDAETVQAMITINGGEEVDRNYLIDRGFLRPGGTAEKE